MGAECPKCEATATRRLQRTKSLGNRFMYFFGLYPWECLTCQAKFYSGTRHSKSGRSPAGEVYIETQQARKVKPGSKESPLQ
jgi:hypothetical protein